MRAAAEPAATGSLVRKRDRGHRDISPLVVPAQAGTEWLALRHWVPAFAGTTQHQPATCLMRAIISSVAFSGVHFSFTTRLIAFAHTFSLLRIVNL